MPDFEELLRNIAGLEESEISAEMHERATAAASAVTEDGKEPAAGTTEDGKKKHKRDEKKKDDNEKKKRMKIEQIERFTIKDVLANPPGTELISIGGLPLSKITLDMLKAFCAKNKISIPMAERKKTAIPAVILSYIKAGPMKERITAGTRKKKGAATTKPACLVTDGTIYRTIITRLL